MILSDRRAELVPEVLAACRELIRRSEEPTGSALLSLCPGHNRGTLREVRDYLVDVGWIRLADFWPVEADERYGLGAADDWEDDVRYALGPPPDRPHPKRRDARRSAAEVRS